MSQLLSQVGQGRGGKEIEAPGRGRRPPGLEVRHVARQGRDAAGQDLGEFLDSAASGRPSLDLGQLRGEVRYNSGLLYANGESWVGGLETGAILGTEAIHTFFPTGEVLGASLKIGDIPVTIIGTFEERVFRWREDQGNQFWWRNRIIAVPANLVQRRMNGDAYRRLDRVTFRIPDMSVMSGFARQLKNLVTANHRLQDDFRLDDVAARVRRMQSQGDVYNLIFLLSGVLALVGGGIVIVNIQMDSLRERVR